MRRPLLLLLSVVALPSLALPACSTLRPAAATVNGTTISQEDFEAELAAIRDNAAYVEAVQGEQGRQVRGDGTGTLSASFVSQTLTNRIIYELIDQELARRRIEVTRADRAAARSLAERNVGGAPVLRRFPGDYRRTLAHRAAALEKLVAEVGAGEPADADVRRFYDENQELFAETCVSHILFAVASPTTGIDQQATAARIEELRAQAAAVRAEIEAGADFAALAQQHSVDPASAAAGGSLGCNPAGAFVPEFEAAAAALTPGQVSEPVQTSFGVHLIKVTERRAAPYDEVEPAIRRQLGSGDQQALQELLLAAIADADISVNPRYGTFEKEAGSPGVVPPSAPTTTEAGAPTAPEGIPGLPLP